MPDYGTRGCVWQNLTADSVPSDTDGDGRLSRKLDSERDGVNFCSQHR